MDLLNESTYVAGDTCKAAVNVVDNIDTDQSDCEMYVVNLDSGYGFGIKEIPGQNKKQTRRVR